MCVCLCVHTTICVYYVYFMQVVNNVILYELLRHPFSYFYVLISLSLTTQSLSLRYSHLPKQITSTFPSTLSFHILIEFCFQVLDCLHYLYQPCICVYLDGTQAFILLKFLLNFIKLFLFVSFKLLEVFYEVYDCSFKLCTLRSI